MREMKLLKNNCIYLLIPFFLFGCKSFGGNAGEAKSDLTDSSIYVDSIFPILGEVFIDSLKIGIKGLNKLEVRQYEGQDSLYIQTLLFERDGKNWKEIQKFEFEISSLPIFDPEVSDFDHDGFSDFSYNSAVAARGANEIRKRFLFDAKRKRLVYIKNSDDYPNLQYNTELNCIDSWMVYGGSSTVFLKLEADTLAEFACVSLFGTEDGKTERTITLTDSNKKKTILLNDFLDDEDVYTRYDTYKIKK